MMINSVGCFLFAATSLVGTSGGTGNRGSQPLVLPQIVQGPYLVCTVVRTPYVSTWPDPPKRLRHRRVHAQTKVHMYMIDIEIHN